MAGVNARSARAQRGAMLVIALMFLTLLTLLGITFAALMKLEREATRNYVDTQVEDLLQPRDNDGNLRFINGGALSDGGAIVRQEAGHCRTSRQ